MAATTTSGIPSSDPHSSHRFPAIAGRLRTLPDSPLVPALAAAALVFVTSAVVLTLEVLAGRLLAPYVGVTLETYTAVIGTVLAGIAAGAWAGGWLADRVDPRRLLGPVVLGGGVLAILSVPVVRALGDATVADVGGASIGLAAAGFFLPALVLSAISPIVVKMQLRELEHTGAVVGRLSGIGTLGALVGTFVTGFVLVAQAPTRPVIYALGGFLVVLGLALWVWLSRRAGPVMGALLVAAVGAVGLAAAADDPCEIESPYACLHVTLDPNAATGRVLWINRDMHSYVDVADPTHLEFDYTNAFADVADTAWPGATRIDALHIGGGGFTMPRYLAATRPGTRSLVLEVDPGVVEIARRRLALRTSPSLRVDVGDARIGIRGVATDSVDLAVGDAFADLSVPWHLTTREFVGQIDRALRPDGVYVMNVIDRGSFRFLRAEIATLRDRFAHVVLMAEPTVYQERYAANFVLAASHRRLDRDELVARAATENYTVRDGDDLGRFVDGADVLTDDYAPVDQWLTGEH